jgi:hypothetical protein
VKTRAELREAGIAMGIPAVVVDKMLDRGFVLVSDKKSRLSVAEECNATPPDRDWPVCAREPHPEGMHQSADLEWYDGEPTLYPRLDATR